MTLRDAACSLLVVAALAMPGFAQPATETGAAAFARRDYAAAADLWGVEAAAGSATAQFGLGLLSDLGLGVARDAAKAMRWYLEAAAAGLPDAQFNVAVMLDAGTGVSRDTGAAAVWYGRAAANGNARAQYNLGLLFAAGDGVPQNADLARYWFGRAAQALPAAAERLAQVAAVRTGQRRLDAPTALAGALVAANGGRRAEIVWAAPPGPPGARFLLEIARLPSLGETSGAALPPEATEASAMVSQLPDPSANYAWRISRVDATAARYAAGPWRALTGSDDAGLPTGRVKLRVAEGDARARRLATELEASFVAAGLWVRVEPAADDAAATFVLYAWREDAGLAGSIAEFLPVLAAEDAVLAPDARAAPGEIVVRLVGGPDPSDP